MQKKKAKINESNRNQIYQFLLGRFENLQKKHEFRERTRKLKINNLQRENLIILKRI